MRGLPATIPQHWAMGFLGVTEVAVAGRRHKLIQEYGQRDGGGTTIWLWPEHAADVLRCERARWTTLLRARRTWERHGTLIAEVAQAGFAYARCTRSKDCQQPCWIRYEADMSGGVSGKPAPALWLDSHVQKRNGRWLETWAARRPPRDWSDEFDGDTPRHLPLGEAYNAAYEAVKTANGRWLAWTEHVDRLLLDHLRATTTAAANRSARVSVNGRDYWYATTLRYGQYQWAKLAFPEDDRVDVDLGGLT